MRKVKFLYLPIESKVRELDAKLLLAIEAINNGFSVVIGSKKMMSKLASLPCGMLFYKDASILMESKFKHAKSLGYKVAVHDEEGFVQFNWDDYLNSRIKFTTGQYVDQFFCWGPGQASAISSAKENYLPNADVITVGHPRIDLLQPALRDYRGSPEKNRKMILVNTKLASVNHIHGKQGFMNILIENGMVNTEEAYQFRLKQVEYEHDLLNAYFRLIDELSEDTEVDIVIRPHPSENPETWATRFAGKSNVYVTNEFPVGYWISKCDCVIHTGCTTAIEAFLMDKPSIAFKPIKNENYDIPLPNDLSIVVDTVPCVLKEVQGILNGKLNWVEFKNSKLDILTASVTCHPDSLSYKHIISELDKVELPVHKFNLFQRVKMKGLFLANSLRLAIARETLNENKIFRKSEVKQTVAGLQQVIGKKSNIRVSQIAPNLFVLYR